ncbi:E3 ubiquitin-protein ligase RNF14-like isoform X1 [Hypomesus transpacificus]|uniref:E3 ubiquitin-protein ligase RNF14-like isoform X1 n=1 Tax=Hypomesus transpacificus TaxID=137520 RepID=UPI001F07BE8D|nr:E3 ubiquitin-protein ligase RNF14-like isoform X1 [Hypomesus transpacificus]
MCDNCEAQKDELLALASIYSDDEFVWTESTSGGEIRVTVDLPRDFSVVIKEGDSLRQHAISFLPPLVLTFNLPGDYPSCSPPTFTLSTRWLSRAQLSAVSRHLEALWQAAEGSVVLFSWVHFLKEDLLSFLHIRPPLVVPVSRAPEEPSQCGDSGACGGADGPGSQGPGEASVGPPEADLLAGLLAYDVSQRRREFEGQVFDCGICFRGIPGSGCFQFPRCGHVFCDPCVAEYFRMQITAGNVQSLTCPESRCDSMATPGQVKQQVGEELFLRYDRLLLQSSLDSMADVVYCPRRGCASAVVLEADRKFGICPACRYAFCSLCRRSYHGHAPCFQKEETAKEAAEDEYAAIPKNLAGVQMLWEDYTTGSLKRRKVLENRYGKPGLLADCLSEDWLSHNSKFCPRCNSKIYKDGGCNRMFCTKCRLRFCWECLGQLNEKTNCVHVS